MTQSSDRLAAFICLLVAGALIGLSTNLAKLAANAGLNPLAFLTWSVAGAALTLTAINKIRHRLPELNRSMNVYFLLSALVSVAAPQLLMFAAVPHVGASFVALSVAFPPLFTYVGAVLLRMDRFHPLRAAGVVLALAGAALLAAHKLSAPDAPALWIAATLLAPIILSIGNLYRTRHWPPGAAPDELAPGMLVASVILLLPAAAIPGFSLEIPSASAVPILLVLSQATIFSAQYWLFFILQLRGGPVYLSLLGSVAAIVGVPIAVLLLGEDWPDGLAIGAGLIALGMLFVIRPSNQGMMSEHRSARR